MPSCWTRWASTSSKPDFPSQPRAISKPSAKSRASAKSAVICGLARAQYGDIDRCMGGDQTRQTPTYPHVHRHLAAPPRYAQSGPWTVWRRAFMTPSAMPATCVTTCNGRRWMRREPNMTISAGCRNRDQSRGDDDQHPDTVGYTAPAESADLIRMLIDVSGRSGCDFATHCHNDLGMATANSLAAVEAGARQIECTINGLGERAGNTALEEVVMAHEGAQGHHALPPAIDTTKIMNISRRWLRCRALPCSSTRLSSARTPLPHESGIHQDGDAEERRNLRDHAARGCWADTLLTS